MTGVSAGGPVLASSSSTRNTEYTLSPSFSHPSYSVTMRMQHHVDAMFLKIDILEIDFVL